MNLGRRKRPSYDLAEFALQEAYDRSCSRLLRSRKGLTHVPLKILIGNDGHEIILPHTVIRVLRCFSNIENLVI